MDILERIRTADAGSIVTISSPCKETGCVQAEGSFPIEDLRKVISAPAVVYASDVFDIEEMD